MIYTAIDTFYVTNEQLKNSPSRKDGIDESTEMTLRIYGCDLIQESGILLKLPQAAMATGQVLFHRFYCKASFARFNVKRVAASCIWLASKLEECPRGVKLVFNVFHIIECRRENKPVDHLYLFLKKYADSKIDFNDTERHLLIEMGFICHIEHPHKFILSYLKALDTPEELRQEAWNLANDSLRTTLCVRFKSEVVACGVVYAAARKFQVPLPEDPPWWEVFDAKKSEIDEVCSVLAHLYSLPKAQYISICEDNVSFALTNRTRDPQVPHNNTNNPTVATNPEADASKEAMVKAALDKLKELKSNDDIKSLYAEAETKEATGVAKSRGEHRTDVNRGRNRDIDEERSKVCDCESRGSGWEMEQKEHGWKRENLKERRQRVEGKGKDTGHPEKSRHYPSRDRSKYYSSSYTSLCERDRHRHHPYA